MPFPVDYAPYTVPHVLNMLQLLLFSGLAFFLLLPMMKRTLTLTLDVDWFYRKAGSDLARFFAAATSAAISAFEALLKRQFNAIVQGIIRTHGPESILARTSAAGTMAMWIVVLLAVYLVLYFL